MKRLFKIIGWLLCLFFVSTVLAVLLYKYVPVQVTPLMIIRKLEPVGTPRQQERERDYRHKWVPLNQMSPWMPKAVVATEDGRFYQHHGFDFEQIQIAIDEAKENKRNRGASTITQQTAKNVFLWPAHSWVRKGLEAYFTVLIEWLWSKDRIMEVYLNSIEMGAGIYGIDAAADHYFHCTPQELTKRQCALIALSLPSPLKRDPANPSRYMLRRCRTVMKYM